MHTASGAAETRARARPVAASAYPSSKRNTFGCPTPTSKHLSVVFENLSGVFEHKGSSELTLNIYLSKNMHKDTYLTLQKNKYGRL